jgi:hypothetical protein
MFDEQFKYNNDTQKLLNLAIQAIFVSTSNRQNDAPQTDNISTINDKGLVVLKEVIELIIKNTKMTLLKRLECEILIFSSLVLTKVLQGKYKVQWLVHD